MVAVTAVSTHLGMAALVEVKQDESEEEDEEESQEPRPGLGSIV